MQATRHLPGFTADYSLEASSGKTRRGIVRCASPTQFLVHPQDACGSCGNCLGTCVCPPFVGCHCVGLCL